MLIYKKINRHLQTSPTLYPRRAHAQRPHRTYSYREISVDGYRRYAVFSRVAKVRKFIVRRLATRDYMGYHAILACLLQFYYATADGYENIVYIL
jgi:hypothetical protein